MMDISARLELPLIAAAQAQKHVTHNEALALLDAIVQLTPEAFDATLPPAAPQEGQVWALGSGAVNAWSGQDGKLAARANGGWLFIAPRAGWRAAIGNDLRVFTGTAWVRPALPDLQNLPGVGIGTSHDAMNPLAVAGPASLFTHTGGGHQIKVNKSAPAATAALLFQTGFSGRAEIGTAGNDDLSVKVSPDGATFVEAMRVTAATGVTAFPAGAALANGTVTAPALGFAGDPNTGLFWGGADVVGLAAGGVERARVTTAGLQVTGLVTGSAVTQGQTDATPGRLLKGGDFGLGATITPLVANLDDGTLPTGFYRTNDITTLAGTWPPSAPTGFGRAGQLLVQRHDGGSVVQLWYSLGQLSMWVRRFSGGSWSAWARPTPVLGTVTQASGVPTGAVFERGSNASGDYVRFADGTQICTRAGLATGTITDADGALFSRADITVTYAANFTATPLVTGTQVADRDVWITPVSSTASVATLRPRSSIAKATGSSFSILAVGRWF